MGALHDPVVGGVSSTASTTLPLIGIDVLAVIACAFAQLSLPGTNGALNSK